MKNDIHSFKSVSLTNRRQQTDFWRAITGALHWLPSDPASLYCLLYFFGISLAQTSCPIFLKSLSNQVFLKDNISD